MKKIILVLILIFLSRFAFADMIVLKSGKVMEAKILERTDEYIKIDFKGVALTYFLDEIESIDGKKPGSAYSQPQSEPAAAEAVNKETIVEKIKNAQKNLTRYQRSTVKDMDIENSLHSKTQEISDIDLENKIISTAYEIKEYEFYLQGIRANLEAKIFESKQKGVPPEKIQQMQASLDQLALEAQKMMDKMAQKMKGIKSSSFLVDNMLYMHIKNKWVKMEFPSAEAFWKLMASAKEGNIDKESLNQIASTLPESAKAQLESLFVYLNTLNTSGGLRNAQSIDRVSKSEFSGVSCYALDIKNNEAMDAMKKAVLAYAKTKGEQDVETLVDSFNYREFVSPDNYLPLGSQVNLQMSFNSAAKTPALLKALMRSEVVYNYPKGKIEVPQELSSAILVKNEEELKNILMEDFQDMFGQELGAKQ